MRQVLPGVAFRLFPQADDTFREPERVLIAPLGGPIGRGPSDRDMVVVDALGKSPYDPPRSMPPWLGPVAPPAVPDRLGGFDHLPIDTREFLQAHLFGCARLALNVWTAYLGEPIQWQSASLYPMLELVPVVDWPNAQSGPGFLETGMMEDASGRLRLFCLNLDVIAHEIGHSVLFSVLGVPAPDRLTAQFLAFHESMADLTTLLVALQFDSVVSHVLDESDGNLYAMNEINRIAELSTTQQIRVADTMARMADVAGIRLREDGTWRDEAGRGRNAHALSAPLTGGLFDFFVTLFQNQLVARGVIPPDDDPNGWTEEEIRASLEHLRIVHRNALDKYRHDFVEAILQARDDLGLCLAESLDLTPPEDFSFDIFAGVLMGVCRRRLGRPAAMALDSILRWRGIVPRRRSPGLAAVAPGRNPTSQVPSNQILPGHVPFAARVRTAAQCCHTGEHMSLGHAFALGQIIRREHRQP